MVTTFNSGKGKSVWGGRGDSAVAWETLFLPMVKVATMKNKCIFGVRGSDYPSREVSRRIRDFDPRGKHSHKQGKSGYHGCHAKWIWISDFGRQITSLGKVLAKSEDSDF